MGKPAVRVGSESRHPGRLEWRTLLQWLLADGLIDEDQLKRTEARFTAGDTSLHPLVRLGNLGLIRHDNGKPLDVDALSEWLARHVDLPFVRIDPLTVDVGRVADIMSMAYAEAKRCLPVQIGLNEVTIATSEPLDIAWVAEIESHSRKAIKLVLANPIAAHTARLEDGRIGHDKNLFPDWAVAEGPWLKERPWTPEYLDEGWIEEAGVALGCPKTAEMLEMIRAPMTRPRFIGNLNRAWEFTRYRIDRVPKYELLRCGLPEPPPAEDAAPPYNGLPATGP